MSWTLTFPRPTLRLSFLINYQIFTLMFIANIFLFNSLKFEYLLSIILLFHSPVLALKSWLPYHLYVDSFELINNIFQWFKVSFSFPFQIWTFIGHLSFMVLKGTQILFRGKWFNVLCHSFWNSSNKQVILTKLFIFRFHGIAKENFYEDFSYFQIWKNLFSGN